MSSFFLLPTSETTRKKTTDFPQTGSSSSFLGHSCTASASQQVSVPAVIRSSADWDATNFKKTKKSKKKKKGSYNGGSGSVKILTEVDRTGCVGC
ncbi:hypothetical protein AALP_AAs63262U000100 [Arabis alpina]|uniref:Uncharacterized protein n=1 Tax=Arabis alpina TaxID=50452 RepID=A0A087G2D4_ARAAL|nr:hypothetical protein AALP_AAs63262U000100 [Arabis alpina]